MALTGPSNTLQLTATPRNPAGAPLTGLGAVSYTPLPGDTSVLVDSTTGLVTAHAVTAQTQVIASLTAQGYTLTDTVDISVDPVPPTPLATFSIHPPPGDSARYSMRPADESRYTLPIAAVNAVGDTVCKPNLCALQIYYTSSNPALVSIDQRTGQIEQSDTGHVLLTATTWAYGISRTDSLRFVSTYSLFTNFQQQSIITTLKGFPIFISYNEPQPIYLGVGATLVFVWPDSADGIDFDKPNDVDSGSYPSPFGGSATVGPNGSGNIPPFGGPFTAADSGFLNECIQNFPGGCQPYLNLYYQIRSFHVPGIIRFHSARYPSDTVELVIQNMN